MFHQGGISALSRSIFTLMKTFLSRRRQKFIKKKVFFACSFMPSVLSFDRKCFHQSKNASAQNRNTSLTENVFVPLLSSVVEMPPWSVKMPLPQIKVSLFKWRHFNSDGVILSRSVYAGRGTLPRRFVSRRQNNLGQGCQKLKTAVPRVLQIFAMSWRTLLTFVHWHKSHSRTSQSLMSPHEMFASSCSDSTNTQVGTRISGERLSPEGGNLRIYWPHSNHAI